MTIFRKHFDVARGSEARITVDPTKTWRIIGATCTFQGSGSGSNRTANWVLHSPDGTTCLRIPLAITVVPGANVDLTAWIGANSVYSPGGRYEPQGVGASLPDIPLPENWTTRPSSLVLIPTRTQETSSSTSKR